MAILRRRAWLLAGVPVLMRMQDAGVKVTWVGKAYANTGMLIPTVTSDVKSTALEDPSLLVPRACLSG